MCDFACVPAICRAFVYNNQTVYSSASVLASFARTVSVDPLFYSI